MSEFEASNVGNAAQVAAKPPVFKRRKRSGDAKRARIKETLFYLSIVLIPMVNFCVFYVYVRFDTLLLSFQKWESETNTFIWVGFENYAKVWRELTMKGSWFNNSLIFSVVDFFIGKLFMLLPLDLLFAYYCYKKMPGWSFFKGTLYLPNILSGMVLGLIIQYMFDNLIPEVASKYFNTNVDPLLLTGGWRAYWTQLLWSQFFSIGGGILLYTAVMSRIPDTLNEYAYLEGCGPLREFLTITMPLIWGTYALSIIGGVAGIVTNAGPWFTYYGTGSTSPTNIGYYIYCLTLDSKGYGNYPYASACGMFFTLFVVPLTFFTRWLVDKIDPKVQY